MFKSLDMLAKIASQKLGTSPEKLKEAASSGKLDEVVKGMTPEQASQVEKILSDKEATSKLLSSPQAQEMLKKILGGNC